MRRAAGGMWRVSVVFALLALFGGCRSREVDCAGPYCADVARLVPLVEKSVGLTFKRPPQVEERSREQVRAFLIQQFREERVMRELAGIEAAYKRFGLIPDTLQLVPFMLALLEEQVVGYFDPKTDVLYVVQGADEAAVNVTLPHELVHALQDQYIDLESIQEIQGENDRVAAAQAVIEGQATFEGLAATFGGGNVAVNLPGGWDRIRNAIRENQSAMPRFAEAPLIIQETLIFPYLSGAEFVRNFKARRGDESLLDDLPTTTEQVMHPSAYFGERDAPTRITLPLRVPPRYENTLGEFETRVLLFEYGKDQNDAVRGASGWDGDRYALIPAAGGEALVWVTAWDSAVEAAEFRDVFEGALARRLGVEASGDSRARTFAAGSRVMQVIAAESGGRAVVVFVDAPAATNPGGLIDVTRIQLTEQNR